MLEIQPKELAHVVVGQTSIVADRQVDASDPIGKVNPQESFFRGGHRDFKKLGLQGFALFIVILMVDLGPLRLARVFAIGNGDSIPGVSTMDGEFSAWVFFLWTFGNRIDCYINVKSFVENLSSSLEVVMRRVALFGLQHRFWKPDNTLGIPRHNEGFSLESLQAPVSEIPERWKYADFSVA
jgi:hypothetical protein